MNIRIDLDKRFKLDTPQGDVSPVGVAEIQRYICALGHPEIDLDFDCSAWVTSRGTLPKRLASHYFKKYGIKLNGDSLGEIGNIAKRHASEGKTHILDFTQKLDWEAGDYGDDGSCFWNSNRHARRMLIENGAYAIRSYYADRNECGAGRAWLVRLNPDLYVVFNGYGDLTTLQFARLLSLYWECSYKRIILRNNGEDSGVLYINGACGYVVGHPAKTESMCRHDFGWDDGSDDDCDDDDYDREDY